MNNKDILETSQMIEVSKMYYEKDMTQSEIANKLYISRTKVSRLLKKARQESIVEIKIKRLLERNYYLEDLIKEKYNLKKVLLYENNTVRDGVTKLAGKYLEGRINEKMIIGTSWGYTVSKAIDSITNTTNMPISVVEIKGTASNANPLGNWNNTANKLASKYGGFVYNMNAPFFVDMEIKEKLQKNPIVDKALKMAIKSEIIITSLGILDNEPPSNPWTGYMTDRMLNELKAQDAVGCIGARFFDSNGKILDNEWDRHCIGPTLEDIRNIKEVVVIAEGKRKAEAILGALRGGYIDVLISDSNTIKDIV